MDHTKIMEVLNVPLDQFYRYAKSFCQEMQSIKSLGLCFCDRWYVGGSWERPKVSEGPPTALEDDSFRLSICWRLMVEHRTVDIWCCRLPPAT